MSALAPELVGLGLLLVAVALLLIEQRVFGYQDQELVQKLIIALVDYGLMLIALAYGLGAV